MGIISIDKVDNLIWLGRYSERVYLTIREFFEGYDKMLENPETYVQYCQQMQIPNIYSNVTDFVDRYILDPNDLNSIYSNLDRAYANCIVLRNEITTETLSYLEMALSVLKDMDDMDAFLLDLQKVIDYILAFWASLEENVMDYEVRSMVKLGKRQECLDMYLRLRKKGELLDKAYKMLVSRLQKNYLPYDLMALQELDSLLQEDNIDYPSAISYVERLI